MPDASCFGHPMQHRDRNTAKGREVGLPRTLTPLLSGEEFRRPRSLRQENCQYKNHERLADIAKRTAPAEHASVACTQYAFRYI